MGRPIPTRSDKISVMSVRQFLIAFLFAATPTLFMPAAAQQAVRVPLEQGGRTLQLQAQLIPAAGAKGPAPAVAIFHG